MSIIWNPPSDIAPRKWSQHDSDEAQSMHDAGASSEEIGKRFGRTASAIDMHLKLRRLGPDKCAQYAAVRNKRRAKKAAPKQYPTERDMDASISFRPTSEMMRDRDMRAALPHRDLTGILCGDPPIGLSALEMRR